MFINQLHFLIAENLASENRALHAVKHILYTSVVQDTVLKIASCIFKIQDSRPILSGILRYFYSSLSYRSIFKMLFKSILGKWKILFQDTFPQILCFAPKVHFATVTY